MILKLPTGTMRAPTFALVDTTAMAFEPHPNVWRVSAFSDETVNIKVAGTYRWIHKNKVAELARDYGLTPDALRATFDTAIAEARAEWHANAIAAMERDYGNTYVTLPAGESIRTHATIDDIERAILAAPGAPIVVVTHAYPELPAFDERGLPESDPDSDDAPF